LARESAAALPKPLLDAKITALLFSFNIRIMIIRRKYYSLKKLKKPDKKIA
jgi:hypothetical protein